MWLAGVERHFYGLQSIQKVVLEMDGKEVCNSAVEDKTGATNLNNF